jgi:hypothetical protein
MRPTSHRRGSIRGRDARATSIATCHRSCGFVESPASQRAMVGPESRRCNPPRHPVTSVEPLTRVTSKHRHAADRPARHPERASPRVSRRVPTGFEARRSRRLAYYPGGFRTSVVERWAASIARTEDELLQRATRSQPSGDPPTRRRGAASLRMTTAGRSQQDVERSITKARPQTPCIARCSRFRTNPPTQRKKPGGLPPGPLRNAELLLLAANSGIVHNSGNVNSQLSPGWTDSRARASW